MPGLPMRKTDQGSITVHVLAAPWLHSCRASSNPERGVKINNQAGCRQEKLLTIRVGNKQ